MASPTGLTKGQELALQQLDQIAEVSPVALEIVSSGPWSRNHDWVEVDLSISCEAFPREPDGLQLRARERVLVQIPPDFPFAVPEARVPHDRFRGYPHVQWKYYLCLYRAKSVEWDPSDGMFGFVHRLAAWFRAGARNQLDPVDAPLHPPVAYTRSTDPHRIVVPRVDTPVVQGQPWIGLARLERVSDSRVDIVEWQPLTAHLREDRYVAPSILLPTEFPFEYPETVLGLVKALESRGVPIANLFALLELSAQTNAADLPLYLVLGTSMRGVRGAGTLRQHLTAWYIDSPVATALRLSLLRHSKDDEVEAIGKSARNIVIDWATEARVSWCSVLDDRQEVTVRRDDRRPISWFRGKTVALWGCGAIGGHVANCLARAGVAKLILRDKGLVTPGLLVRQPFEDRDIGRPKVEALAEHLQLVRPDLEVETNRGDICRTALESEDWTDAADILIDATACELISSKLELRRREKDTTAPIVSMAVDSLAQSGLVTVSLAGHTGGPFDVTRAAKISICSTPHLSHIADLFWQSAPRFEPEPGCSEPTFQGSAADCSALAADMLNTAARQLSDATSTTASAHIVGGSSRPVGTSCHQPSSCDLQFLPDIITTDPHAEYEVRITVGAWNEMTAWANRVARTRSEDVETGGILFGERDDASRVIWVTEVLGPPPDSTASPTGFVCGVQGVQDAHEEKAGRTRQSVSFLGMWHTHPKQMPLPSETDVSGMHDLVFSVSPPSPQAFMLIIGDPLDRPTLAAYLFKRADFERKTGLPPTRQCAVAVPEIESATNSPRVGLALSGGGSRAIAFHLGCLRALQDKGLLHRVEVISSVSGGSVLNALYAYDAEGSFADFDARVTTLLHTGLVGPLLRQALLPTCALQTISTALIAGSTAQLTDALRTVLQGISRVLPGIKKRRGRALARVQPPFRRWASRTTAFQEALDHLFRGSRLSDKTRHNVRTVLNACEIRTGSAFRFSNDGSSCWRYGALKDNDLPLALAVAASAAYPALLPAIDQVLTFVDPRTGHDSQHRVLLTDGGVYENLGVSCLEPGRSPSHSGSTFELDYIICCAAGPGLWSDEAIPYWWPTRMARSFDSVFRKAQDASFKRLHHYVSSGQLQGFALPYLGQQDNALPYRPPDLVRREEVCDYPTDFSPMEPDAIERLALRGEQLTRILIARYCPYL